MAPRSETRSVLERCYHDGYLAHLDRLGIPRPGMAKSVGKAITVAARESPERAATVAAEIQRQGLTLPAEVRGAVDTLARWAPSSRPGQLRERER